MPCFDENNVPPGYIAKFPEGPTYEEEADCLDACAEGACCEVDGSCNIKPQCECDTENGAVFAGVGETCEACTNPCRTNQWPDSIDVDVAISVDPGPEVGLVTAACYAAYKQSIEGLSGQYTLTEVGKDRDALHTPSRVLGIYQFLESLDEGTSWQCSIDGPVFGTSYTWIGIDFRCSRYYPLPAQSSAFGIYSGPLLDCENLPEIPGDRYIRNDGGAGGFGVGTFNLDNSLETPLGDFLEGAMTIQSVFPGRLNGCDQQNRGQPEYTEIAVVTVTVTPVSNPLP